MAQHRPLVAADIMTKNVVTSGPNDDLTRIAQEMQRHKIGSVVIVEHRKPVGILTERDFVSIVERVGAMLERSLVKYHMTTPVLAVHSDTPLADVVKLMDEKHVRHIVVLEKNGEVAGMVSSRDLMKVKSDAATLDEATFAHGQRH
jgi:CBS domain-containing protein